MSSAWFSKLLGRGCRASQRRGGTCRRLRPTRFLPSLEALEARWLPSTLDGGLGDGLAGLGDGLGDQGSGQQSSGAGGASPSQSTLLTVQNLNESGPGSLRQTLLDANGTAGDHTITFAGGVRGTINLLTALPGLSGSIDLEGPGASQLTVQRSGGPYSPEFEIFTVTSGARVTIAGLTLSNGRAPSGGGISNAGTLTVTDSVLSGNTADFGAGGGIMNQFGTLALIRSTVRGSSGTGVYSSGGTVVITSSAISGTSSSGFGGGIYNGGTMTITDSTVSGNTAAFGGGIDNGGTLTLASCTVSGNTAVGNFVSPGTGGGISSSAYLVVTNSLIAGNTGSGSPDVNGAVTSLGHNLIGDATGSSGFTAPGDLVGTSAAPIDPRLGPLQDNGGPTPTRALLAGSPALDAGDPAQLGVADQRGVVRRGGVNVGAFQASASALALAAPKSARAGAPLALVVTATDPFGQAAVGYRGTVHLSSSDPHAVLPADYTFTAADNGARTFPVTLKTAGSQSISATDSATGGITGSATRITITPAAASQLVMTAPSGATAGVAFSLTVTVRDAYGNVATGFSGRVGLSVASGPGNFTRGRTLTAVAHNGSAAFGDLVLNAPGTYRLKAVSGALAAAASGPLVVAQDVSQLVRVAGSAMIRTGPTEYRQVVAITNASGRPLSGPLALLVSNLSRGAVLSDVSGSFLGHPYVDFLAVGQLLKAGQRVIVTLTFLSATAPSPGYTAQVLRGI